MKVRNMESSKGNKVANQFIIDDATINIESNGDVDQYTGKMFQSYESNIVFISRAGNVFLDQRYWDYSRTTGKYRNYFLNETKEETIKKIDSGEYTLVSLN